MEDGGGSRVTSAEHTRASESEPGIPRPSSRAYLLGGTGLTRPRSSAGVHAALHQTYGSGFPGVLEAKSRHIHAEAMTLHRDREALAEEWHQLLVLLDPTHPEYISTPLVESMDRYTLAYTVLLIKEGRLGRSSTPGSRPATATARQAPTLHHAWAAPGQQQQQGTSSKASGTRPSSVMGSRTPAPLDWQQLMTLLDSTLDGALTKMRETGKQKPAGTRYDLTRMTTEEKIALLRRIYRHGAALKLRRPDSAARARLYDHLKIGKFNFDYLYDPNAMRAASSEGSKPPAARSGAKQQVTAAPVPDETLHQDVVEDSAQNLSAGMEQNAKQLDCDESEGKDETETVIYEGNGEDSSSAAGQQEVHKTPVPVMVDHTVQTEGTDTHVLTATVGSQWDPTDCAPTLQQQQEDQQQIEALATQILAGGLDPQSVTSYLDEINSAMGRLQAAMADACCMKPDTAVVTLGSEPLSAAVTVGEHLLPPGQQSSGNWGASLDPAELRAEVEGRDRSLPVPGDEAAEGTHDEQAQQSSDTAAEAGEGLETGDPVSTGSASRATSLGATTLGLTLSMLDRRHGWLTHPRDLHTQLQRLGDLRNVLRGVQARFEQRVSPATLAAGPGFAAVQAVSSAEDYVEVGGSSAAAGRQVFTAGAGVAGGRASAAGGSRAQAQQRPRSSASLQGRPSRADSPSPSPATASGAAALLEKQLAEMAGALEALQEQWADATLPWAGDQRDLSVPGRQAEATKNTGAGTESATGGEDGNVAGGIKGDSVSAGPDEATDPLSGSPLPSVTALLQQVAAAAGSLVHGAGAAGAMMLGPGASSTQVAGGAPGTSAGGLGAVYADVLALAGKKLDISGPLSALGLKVHRLSEGGWQGFAFPSGEGVNRNSTTGTGRATASTPHSTFTYSSSSPSYTSTTAALASFATAAAQVKRMMEALGAMMRMAEAMLAAQEQQHEQLRQAMAGVSDAPPGTDHAAGEAAGHSDVAESRDGADGKAEAQNSTGAAQQGQGDQTAVAGEEVQPGVSTAAGTVSQTQPSSLQLIRQLAAVAGGVRSAVNIHMGGILQGLLGMRDEMAASAEEDQRQAAAAAKAVPEPVVPARNLASPQRPSGRLSPNGRYASPGGGSVRSRSPSLQRTSSSRGTGNTGGAANSAAFGGTRSSTSGATAPSGAGAGGVTAAVPDQSAPAAAAGKPAGLLTPAFKAHLLSVFRHLHDLTLSLSKSAEILLRLLAESDQAEARAAAAQLLGEGVLQGLTAMADHLGSMLDALETLYGPSPVPPPAGEGGDSNEDENSRGAVHTAVATATDEVAPTTDVGEAEAPALGPSDAAGVEALLPAGSSEGADQQEGLQQGASAEDAPPEQRQQENGSLGPGSTSPVAAPEAGHQQQPTPVEGDTQATQDMNTFAPSADALPAGTQLLEDSSGTTGPGPVAEGIRDDEAWWMQVQAAYQEKHKRRRHRVHAPRAPHHQHQHHQQLHSSRSVSSDHGQPFSRPYPPTTTSSIATSPRPPSGSSHPPPLRPEWSGGSIPSSTCSEGWWKEGTAPCTSGTTGTPSTNTGPICNTSGATATGRGSSATMVRRPSTAHSTRSGITRGRPSRRLWSDDDSDDLGQEMCNLCEETDDEDDELHLTVIPHHTHEPGGGPNMLHKLALQHPHLRGRLGHRARRGLITTTGGVRQAPTSTPSLSSTQPRLTGPGPVAEGLQAEGSAVSGISSITYLRAGSHTPAGAGGYQGSRTSRTSVRGSSSARHASASIKGGAGAGGGSNVNPPRASGSSPSTAAGSVGPSGRPTTPPIKRTASASSQGSAASHVTQLTGLSGFTGVGGVSGSLGAGPSGPASAGNRGAAAVTSLTPARSGSLARQRSKQWDASSARLSASGSASHAPAGRVSRSGSGWQPSAEAAGAVYGAANAQIIANLSRSPSRNGRGGSSDGCSRTPPLSRSSSLSRDYSVTGSRQVTPTRTPPLQRTGTYAGRGSIPGTPTRGLSPVGGTTPPRSPAARSGSRGTSPGGPGAQVERSSLGLSSSQAGRDSWTAQPSSRPAKQGAGLAAAAAFSAGGGLVEMSEEDRRSLFFVWSLLPMLEAYLTNLHMWTNLWLRALDAAWCSARRAATQDQSALSSAVKALQAAAAARAAAKAAARAAGEAERRAAEDAQREALQAAQARAQELEQRLMELESKLAQVQEELASASASPAAGEDVLRAEELSKQVASLQATIDSLQSEADSNRKRARELEEALGEKSKLLTDTEDSLKRRIAELEAELKAEREKKGPAGPPVVEKGCCGC